MAVERTPITSEELFLLTDPAALMRACDDGPVSLVNRNVSGLKIRDMVFSKVTFLNVAFSNVEFELSQFRGAQFDGVTFESCRFGAVDFDACAMNSVAWRNCELEDVKLTCLHAQQWSSQSCRFAATHWDACKLTGWKELGSIFERSRWSDVTIVGPDWQGTKLNQPKIQRLNYVGGEASGVCFVESDATGLGWSETALDGLELLLGSYRGLSFESIRGGGLRVVEANCRGIGLLNCGRLAGVAVTGGECQGFVIQNCRELAMLTVGYAVLHSLLLQGCRVSGAYFTNSRLVTEHQILDCELDGLDFEGSEIENLTVSSSAIAACLRTSGARFVGLKLTDVSYGPLEVEAEGAAYQRGDVFPS